MSVAANKQLARDFFARFADRDTEGALAAMAEAELTNGLRFTVRNVIAEGDQVAIELESYGELRNGRVYNNQYHTLLTIRDGKIREVREYLDTQHVYATWFRRGE